MNQHVFRGSFGSNECERTGTALERFVRSGPFRVRTEPRTGAAERLPTPSSRACAPVMGSWQKRRAGAQEDLEFVFLLELAAMMFEVDAARGNLWPGFGPGFSKSARIVARMRRHNAKTVLRAPMPKAGRPRCGARCRTKGGAPCGAPPVWDTNRDAPANGRCRLHGGLSTGPKTLAGREAIAEARRREARQRRQP